MATPCIESTEGFYFGQTSGKLIFSGAKYFVALIDKRLFMSLFRVVLSLFRIEKTKIIIISQRQDEITKRHKSATIDKRMCKHLKNDGISLGH